MVSIQLFRVRPSSRLLLVEQQLLTITIGGTTIATNVAVTVFWWKPNQLEGWNISYQGITSKGNSCCRTVGANQVTGYYSNYCGRLLLATALPPGNGISAFVAATADYKRNHRCQLRVLLEFLLLLLARLQAPTSARCN
jgi:hypothetical protein